MRSFLLLTSSLASLAVAVPARAAEQPLAVQPTDPVAAAPDSDAEQASDPLEILVVATRIRGQIDAAQVPVITLDEAQIASYGAASLTDLITALAPQTGSGRGRGDGRPIILFNGQRISSFREFRNIPPEAIRKVEVLPEEVALRYGYPPNQRVMNFILRDNFQSRSFDVEYNFPSRGGFAETEFEASLLKIDRASRLNLNVQLNDTSMLTESERDLVQAAGTTPSLASDPDPAANRSLVADSRSMAMTASWSTGLGKDGTGGSLSANGTLSRSDSLSLSGLDSVLLLAPGGGSALRTLGGALKVDNRTTAAAFGTALNTSLGTWQVSATVDGGVSNSASVIDRRANTAALLAAAAAGTLAVEGPLPVQPPRGTDVATTRTTNMASLLTVNGSPFRLPAGYASLTLRSGFAYNAIRSEDTRSGLGETRLDRGDLNAGVNLALPLTSRRDDVLAAIGDLTANASVGVNRLSDFGTLKDWSVGLTWGPTERLAFQASYFVNEAAPSLGDLGNPLVTTFNVPVYDFARGETVIASVSTGGNAALQRETQRDFKLGMTWQVPWLSGSNLLAEYFRNNSNDVTSALPVLTPAIEAAFPGRVTRDASGRLVAIDRRPVTLAETSGSRFRYGFNVGGTIGKAPPGAGRGAGGPGIGGGGGGPRPAGPGGGTGMGRGGGGGPMMGMFGGGGQGRWNLSVYHTVRLSERVLVAPGGPELDLLEGDALSGGGAVRHALEFEGGLFHKGMGLRLNGSYSAPTSLRASGAPGTSDLRFGSLFRVDARLFFNFDQQKKLVEAVPFLKGARISLVADNLFESRQRVTDASGTAPLGYQPDYLDPRGRMLGIDFRKIF